MGIMPIKQSLGSVLVHENMVLIEAQSEFDALRKAKAIGQTETALQDELSLDGVPAKRVFAGIRKVVVISNPDTGNLDQDRPSDGTEISYSVYKVSSQEELRQLAEGAEVTVQYVE